MILHRCIAWIPTKLNTLYITNYFSWLPTLRLYLTTANRMMQHIFYRLDSQCLRHILHRAYERYFSWFACFYYVPWDSQAWQLSGHSARSWSWVEYFALSWNVWSWEKFSNRMIRVSRKGQDAAQLEIYGRLFVIGCESTEEDLTYIWCIGHHCQPCQCRNGWSEIFQYNNKYWSWCY